MAEIRVDQSQKLGYWGVGKEGRVMVPVLSQTCSGMLRILYRDSLDTLLDPMAT